MSIQVSPADTNLAASLTRILNSGDDRELLAQYLAAALQQFGAAAAGGGAAGSLTYGNFNANSGNPPAANYATFDTINSIPVLDFPNGSTNATFFVSALPQGAAFTNGLKVNIIWVSSVTTGSVSWGVAFEDTQGAAISSDHWLAQVTVSGAANGTANKPAITSITVPLANLGALAAESAFRLRVQRLTGDTLAGVAQLIAVTVEAA